ncbi:mitochondrial ribonuclease P protein 1-like protein [Dinothrombium tinctorium]|uniref:RNA (guanine-9-)-methyltransferase domain-containing protein 1 n=1 Tax=Dinothrombium tinctorium TaxID=1965070 RepID=A0A3S3PGS9_9ACAR|nr:mitochondrial ribonuclease P protein 1-like protein [Dinothrombium tinctorium]RWS09358.1 mitochondrial ribonuclease P protein 1-like protein [Dinothrombium tinctorium]
MPTTTKSPLASSIVTTSTNDQIEYLKSPKTPYAKQSTNSESILKSTTELTTENFAQLTTELRATSLKHGITTSSPITRNLDEYLSTSTTETRHPLFGHYSYLTKFLRYDKSVIPKFDLILYLDSNVDRIAKRTLCVSSENSKTSSDSNHNWNKFERDFVPLAVENFRELIVDKQSEDEVRRALKLYEYLKYTTGDVPVTLDVASMRRLMKESEEHQKQTFKYLFRIEASNRKREREKKENEMRMQQRREEYDSRPLELRNLGVQFHPETNAPVYGLWKNALFVKISNAKILRALDAKMLASLLFGQNLVFDCDYDFMDERRVSNTTKQIALCFGANKHYKYPFHLWFCNLKKDSRMSMYLEKNIGNIFKPNSFVTVKEQSYLDFFPRKNLVYITPEARTQLTKFSHEDIYIIGAYNNKYVLSDSERRASIMKAKREGLRTARLPIDEYLIMKSSKTLTIDQVFRVIATRKQTGDWEEALKKWVPKRKIKTEEEIEMEQQYRRTKLEFKKKPLFQRF